MGSVFAGNELDEASILLGRRNVRLVGSSFFFRRKADSHPVQPFSILKTPAQCLFVGGSHYRERFENYQCLVTSDDKKFQQDITNNAMGMESKKSLHLNSFLLKRSGYSEPVP